MLWQADPTDGPHWLGCSSEAPEEACGASLRVGGQPRTKGRRRAHSSPHTDVTTSPTQRNLANWRKGSLLHCSLAASAPCPGNPACPRRGTLTQQAAEHWAWTGPSGTPSGGPCFPQGTSQLPVAHNQRPLAPGPYHAPQWGWIDTCEEPAGSLPPSLSKRPQPAR